MAYYRVSTGRQEFGLSFEAQRESVTRYVIQGDGSLVGEFSETVSGRRNNRPQLKKALWLCGIMRATLVISRLDRLSRNVELISHLMESGVEFVAVDFPFANKFTVHVLAAIAEYESRLISERMKAINAVNRARGGKNLVPKNPHPQFGPGCHAASARSRKEKSERLARDVAPLLWAAVRAGKSYQVIAAEFNESGVTPPRDKPWKLNAISRIARQTGYDFGFHATRHGPVPIGMPQFKVQNKLREIGSVLVGMRRDGLTYESMSIELEKLGFRAPRGGVWRHASLRRYIERTNLLLTRVDAGGVSL